jgi:hypothetical protein
MPTTEAECVWASTVGNLGDGQGEGKGTEKNFPGTCPEQVPGPGDPH